MCSITCKCGHEADYEEFQSTPIGGVLPRDEYQCPKCRRRWRYDQAPGKRYESGFYIPGKRKLEELSPTL
jgi:hypothetical protein